MGIAAILIICGVAIFTIGAIKAIKSKFSDLMALIWIWLGVCILNIVLAVMGVMFK